MTALARKFVPAYGNGVPAPNRPSRNDKAKVANSNHFPDPHLKTSLSHGQHAKEGTQMSLDQSSREFDLGQRLAQALRKRIFRDRAITIKQLAYALQTSEQTIWNWLNGNSEPKGTHLVKLIFFFDGSFSNELFAGTGATIVKMDRARNYYEASQRLHAAMEDLKKFGEVGE